MIPNLKELPFGPATTCHARKLAELGQRLITCDDGTEVGPICEIMRQMSRALGVESECDQPAFWQAACAKRSFSFDYPGAIIKMPLMRWKQTYETFCSLSALQRAALSNLNATVVQTGGIPPRAFDGCKYLNLSRLPASTRHIGAAAFRGCVCLELVELPSGLRSIDSFAFGGCANLNICALPERLTAIHTNAFALASSETQRCVDAWAGECAMEEGDWLLTNVSDGHFCAVPRHGLHQRVAATRVHKRGAADPRVRRRGCVAAPGVRRPQRNWSPVLAVARWQSHLQDRGGAEQRDADQSGHSAGVLLPADRWCELRGSIDSVALDWCVWVGSSASGG